MEEEAGRNHRVKAIQLGDMYSDTADAFCLLGLDASVASVSERAIPVLILLRHSLVRIALMCGTDRRLSEDDPLTQQIPTRVRSECMQTGINGPCCIHITLP